MAIEACRRALPGLGLGTHVGRVDRRARVGTTRTGRTCSVDTAYTPEKNCKQFDKQFSLIILFAKKCDLTILFEQTLWQTV